MTSARTIVNATGTGDTRAMTCWPERLGAFNPDRQFASRANDAAIGPPGVCLDEAIATLAAWANDMRAVPLRIGSLVRIGSSFTVTEQLSRRVGQLAVRLQFPKERNVDKREYNALR